MAHQTHEKGMDVLPPDTTKQAVAIHKTPSDARWYENCMKYLRRGGFSGERWARGGDFDRRGPFHRL